MPSSGGPNKNTMIVTVIIVAIITLAIGYYMGGASVKPQPAPTCPSCNCPKCPDCPSCPKCTSFRDYMGGMKLNGQYSEKKTSGAGQAFQMYIEPQGSYTVQDAINLAYTIAEVSPTITHLEYWYPEGSSTKIGVLFHVGNPDLKDGDNRVYVASRNTYNS